MKIEVNSKISQILSERLIRNRSKLFEQLGFTTQELPAPGTVGCAKKMKSGEVRLQIGYAKSTRIKNNIGVSYAPCIVLSKEEFDNLRTV